MIHNLFRHGDRNPLWQLPGVPYNVSYWPEGWGQLTSIGKEQHLKLGKWLRSRYNDFLDSTYKANDIYVQSSDFDRTIMSAQANLAGLYPPIKNDNCNPDLWWQLIPVHTRVWKTDYLIGGKVPKYCRGYYKELAKYYKTPEAQNMLTKAQPYFEFLTNKTGKSIHTTKMLTYIRDSWIVQSDHKFRIPKWAKKLLHEDKQFYKVALFTYEAMCATPKLAKYFSGFLFKKILDRFTSKVQKTLYPNRKFWIYSSHDTAVISFAKALNIFDLFRHGDRSPQMQAPGDPYDVSYWPDGWGQLTSLGKEQHLKLGKWLRSRYSDFLSSTYHTNDIYVQSSDYDRTLMSAQADLAGLYPPKKNANYSPNLWWQLIPVHTRPLPTDYLIGGEVPASCKAFFKELAKYYQSPEAQNMVTKAQPYFAFLTNKTGVPITNLSTLTLLRDSWLVESDHNLRIPKWAELLLKKDKTFYKLALFSYESFFATPTLVKFGAGFLLKDMFDRFTSKIEKVMRPDRKFWIYSSHDTTVMAILKALGVFDGVFPDYTATILTELRFYKDEYYVQMIYKNLNAIPKVIDIPGCGEACPLWKIRKIFANILPKKPFDVECQIN
ncbi:Prostatic acid phosphatase [Pseudolycoriella hygida]|uniref:acid phosphatase n=1 Tax=Pseudolycoriella hygida TaxID=35572 RepID=A0A9Q0MPP8_9DIPT|nr:Prostatic acid phosphatase [Pseudolycoriella hygida]